MTPYKQLYRHRPEDGEYGDCGRTVVACLLDMHPSEVPHFFEDDFKVDDPKKFTGLRKMEAWLRDRGLCVIRYPFDGEVTLENLLCQFVEPGLFYILQGESKNGSDHVVICENGRIVHDPAQDNSGIVGPCPNDGLWWIEFIVPIQEWKDV